VFERESRLRNVDDQLQVARREAENLRFSNNNLLDRNQDIKSEIDALQAHCSVLQG
jgi:FtsZ-binding cell division protein ZapB